MSSEISQGSRSFYDLLGIAPNADADEVRRAYRALARLLHPDVNAAPDAAARFAQISEAYAVLSDPSRRSVYDAGRRPVSRAQVRMPSAHGATVAAQGVLRGADVEAEVHLSLREAAFGIERSVRVERREVCAVCVGKGAAKDGTSIRCPACLGSGDTRNAREECARCQGSGVIGDPPCPNCHGSGRRHGSVSMTVAIPPGVEDGQVLRLKGDGDAGPRNGPRGDLLLRIAVEPDPVLRREGIDMVMDLPLSAQDAERGCHVEVPTLRGPKRLRVPPGTADHAVLRIGGAGIRLPGAWHRGDQFVVVHRQDAMTQIADDMA
jgi:molecular chaperone DnaJ